MGSYMQSKKHTEAIIRLDKDFEKKAKAKKLKPYSYEKAMFWRTGGYMQKMKLLTKKYVKL